MWQDEIDTKLEAACESARMPNSLALPAPLRSAFERFDVRSSRDPRTFSAVKAVTGWVIGAVGEIARVRNELADNQLLRHLRKWQTEQTVKLDDISHVHTLLQLRNWNHTASGNQTLYQLGRAMASAALCMEETYSLNEKTPDASPREADMLDVVVRIAIVTHVHRAWCGQEASETAIAHLVDSLSKL